MTIDEFVLEEAYGKSPLLERYRPVLELGDRKNVLVVKHETLVAPAESDAEVLKSPQAVSLLAWNVGSSTG